MALSGLNSTYRF